MQRRSRPFLYLLLPALLPSLVVPASLLAAPNPPRRKEKAEHPASLKNFVDNETDRLEAEMATLIQQKASVGGAAVAWVDLRIDSRALSRWLCQQLMTADSMSDMQAVAWLRYQDSLALSATLDGANLNSAPTPAQSAALLKIHKVTFDIKDAASIADIDALLTPLRDPLIAALGAKKADDLRPVLPTAFGNGPAKGDQVITATDAPMTLDAMTTRVTQMSISPNLRQSLLAAIGQAKAASADDAAKVSSMLRDAVNMAAMLQTNFAVDPDSRAKMESDLGQAAVMFSDPRIRDSGRKKLDGLRTYRVLVARVAAMKLSPELLKAFAPALSTARDQPDTTDKILTAIEQFIQIDARMAGRRPAAANDAASRAAEVQLKNYAVQRADVFTNADVADSLTEAVAKLKQTADLYELLKTLPQTQAQLLALHPKPTGGVEKRITQAIVHSAENDPQQEESIKTLMAVGTFVSNWQAATAAMKTPISDDAMQTFTGKKWSQAVASVNGIASDLATSLAGGGDLDEGKIDALGRMPDVIASLRRAGDLTKRLLETAGVERWVDCDLDEKKMGVAIDHYRTDFSAVATDAITGGGDQKAFNAVEKKYRGLLNTLELIAAVSPACSKFPSDLGWLVCRFTTPSDHTPREAAVRKLCWTNDLLAVMQDEPDIGGGGGDSLRDQMLRDLTRMVPVPPTVP